MATKIYESEWKPRPCPLCRENDAIDELGHRTRELTATGGVYIFELHDSVCNRCGFVFNRCIPDEDFIREYYQTSTMLLKPNYDLGARMNLVEKTIPEGSTVIEFGSKAGEFVRALNDNGYDADGYDFLTNNSLSRKYDVALAYFILEHVLDPHAFLDMMIDALNENGMIIIEIPDYENYPLHSLYLEHLNHFTPHHLITLLTLHGLQVIEMPDRNSRKYGMIAIARKGLARINSAKYKREMDAFEIYWQNKMKAGHGSKVRCN